MQRVAEGRHLIDAVDVAEIIGKGHQLCSFDQPSGEIGAVNHLIHRAPGDDPSRRDVDDAVAPLGLVHVVGRYQHRQTLAGQRMDLVPELAPRLGVDTGRRLVKQQELRRMHDTGGERQPLLPAARQRAGQLILPLGEAEPLQRAIDLLADRLQPIEPRHEFEILPDRQVLIEGEALRHVANLELDTVALGDDVEPKAGALPRVRFQQSAQHADGRGLAAAIRPEEAYDLPFLHLEIDVVDHHSAAEALGQPLHLDYAHSSLTSTGWPGWSVAPERGSGRASTAWTSVSRLSTLYIT